MRDGDELARTACQALTAQVRHAVLGDDVVDVVLARRADGAGRERGLDLADRAALGGGGKGDEALAALRLRRAAHIVDLAAGAGHVLRADALGADLAPEVDLQRGVDGDHVVVPADDRRVVHIVHREDGDAGVIVDIVIDPLGAEGKGGDALAPVDLLFAVVDRAALDQLHHGVGEHLGVDAQVVLVFQGRAHRVGDGADAQLDAGAVLDALGDQAADLLADGVDPGGGQGGQLVADLDEPVHLADVDLRAADGPGLPIVDLQEDALRLLDHGRAVGTDRAQGEPAVLVHGRDLDQEGVVLVHPPDVAGDVPIIVGNNVSEAAVDGSAGAAAGKPGLAGELAEEAVVRQVLQGVHVQQSLDLHPAELIVRRPPGDGADERGRLGGGGVHADEPAALHLRRNGLRRRALCLKHRPEIRHFSLLPGAFPRPYRRRLRLR